MTKKQKYFGTDGIRGHVGQLPITADFILKLGWAIGKVVAKHGGDRVLIGKDTRISGYMLESALEAGLSAAGVDIYLLGPMPTPAIAYLTRTLRADAGIVISASHNLFGDNGVKFFSAEGFKLPDSIELEIEAQLEKPLVTVDSASLGKASRVNDAAGRYIEFCKSTTPISTELRGMKIVVDCANGATYHIAPNVFRELGADVVELATDPDGLNINADCGATNTKQLQATVLDEQADLGIALDGDGDRLMMVDHKGEVVNGDELLFIIAKDYMEKNRLQGGVVGTLMSNFGLELAFKKMGIDFIRANVGDRYVFEAMKKNGWRLGGESSGHIICLGATTTGDGIVSALQVLTAMRNSDKTLHELKQGMQKSPQKMINVNSASSKNIIEHQNVKKAIAMVEEKLADKGRVLLRPSGTEPVIRVMVEGEDRQQVEELALYLSQQVEAVVTSEKAV